MLMSVKATWSWNGSYQGLYDKAKRLTTRDACMEFYEASKPLYLEMDTSGIDPGACLMQMHEGMNCGCNEVLDNAALCPIAFASKILSSMEWQYSNIENEAQGTLHGLEKFDQ